MDSFKPAFQQIETWDAIDEVILAPNSVFQSIFLDIQVPVRTTTRLVKDHLTSEVYHEQF